METFAMTTLILAASLSRWQLHQEFLLEEKTECPPTDGPPKNHPHIPPKKSMSVYRKNVFVGSRAASCVWTLGGVLNWRRWKKRSPFLGVTKGSYPSYPPPPPTVESDSCGTTGCAKNCRRTGLGLQPSSNTTGTFPSLLVFLNPETNVPEKHGGFFLGTCFFGILSGQNTLDLQDLPLVFVLCCLELLILTIWLQYRIQVFGICKNISPNGDLTH